MPGPATLPGPAAGAEPHAEPHAEPSAEPRAFSSAVIAWQARCGRHDLPWQQTDDPYRIWVSEIMLQQTQVASVLGRYERFLGRFPNVQTLADAALDDVLALWSGLGYYTRARNLHACAREVMARHAGRFPRDVMALAALPGIGRSTAAAIAVFSGGEAAPILDGNVKRVLARRFAIEGWTGSATVERQLWSLAASLLPTTPDVAQWRRYTQGLMDLGATVCTPRRPDCERCPLIDQCLARAQDQVDRLPTPRPPRRIPIRHAHWALMVHRGQVLLEVRPARGLWGGLWSLPEVQAPATGPALALEAPQVQRWSQAWLENTTPGALRVDRVQPAETVHHAFTHFKLESQVWDIGLSTPSGVREGADRSQWPSPSQSQSTSTRWLPLTRDAIDAAPLATPVRTVLTARTSDQGRQDRR